MRRWAERGAAALGVCALWVATGCNGFFVYPGSLTGTSSTTTATGDYVYVANATTGTLAGFTIGTGTLTAVSGSPYSLGFVPTAVVVNPANTIVFVAGTSGLYAYINAYAISATGTLSLLTSNNVASAAEVSMDISPDGNWLIGLDASGSNLNEAILDEYQINTSTGQLTAETGTGNTYVYSGSIPTIVARQVKFAPNGAYVFAAMGTAGDLVFPFSTSSGVFSSPLLLGESSTGTSDNALAVNSASSYLYVARSGTQGGLAVYTIGSGGALSEVTGSPFTAGSQPFSVVVNKAGTAVYVANQLDSTISGYSISSSGGVAALSTATDATPAQPKTLAIDNSGSYLLALSYSGNPDLAMFSYDSASTGKLDLAASTATGTDPAGAIAIAATH